VFGLDIQVEIALIGFIQAIVVAVLGLSFRKERAEHNKAQQTLMAAQQAVLEAQKRAEERAVLRAEESNIVMKQMSVITDLSILNSKMFKKMEVNGELDSALDAAKNVKKEYHDFMRKAATQAMYTNAADDIK